MTACVYGLIDPIDNKIFYIGQTKRKLKQRFLQHIRAIEKTKNQKNSKIKKILESGALPKYIVLEWVFNYQVINEREKYWINHYKKICELTNLCNLPYNYEKSGKKYHGAKLCEKDILEIIDLYVNTNMNMTEIGREYGVKGNTISGIVNGDNWLYITNGKLVSKYGKTKPSMNGIKNHMTKLKDEDIDNIRNMLNCYSQREIGEMYGVSRQVIFCIKYNKTWKHTL